MEIKPYEKNAKLHPKRQLELIAKSLQRFGWQQPIKCGADGVILVGHGRWQAYQLYKTAYKLAEPWVVNESGETVMGGPETRKLTKAEENAYRLADNKLNESDWDMELAIEELKELDDDLFEITGFDKDLIIDEEEKDDEVPEVEGATRSKPGDLYQLGSHKLLVGDSTSFADLERLMGQEKAICVFTDPPYNVDYKGSAGKIKNDKFENKVAFYQFLYDAIASFRPFAAGDVYIAMSSSELHTLQKAFEDCGGHWSTFIIWVKDRFTLGRANYQRQYEPILYGWFEGSSHYWSGKRNLGDVVKDEVREDPVDGSKFLKIEEGGIETDIWEVSKPKQNKVHPTMKPVSLCQRGIVNSSMPGDIILDPFLGSGSTLITAEKTGRKCYGLELDPKFADVIVQRYVNYTGDTNIKLNGERITWEVSEESQD